jgi:hypothetical protein
VIAVGKFLKRASAAHLGVIECGVGRFDKPTPALRSNVLDARTQHPRSASLRRPGWPHAEWQVADRDLRIGRELSSAGILFQAQNCTFPPLQRAARHIE